MCVVIVDRHLLPGRLSESRGHDCAVGRERRGGFYDDRFANAKDTGGCRTVRFISCGIGQRGLSFGYGDSLRDSPPVSVGIFNGVLQLDTLSTLCSQPVVSAVNVFPQMVTSPFRLDAPLIFSVKFSPV